MYRAILFPLPLLALALVGCGGNVLPAETDPAKGREVLVSTLDTWKKGGTPAEVRPVVVADPDWEEGHTLTKYEVDPTDGRAGVDLLLKVKLTVQRKDGRTEEKSVNYVVAIGAQTAVLRYQ